MSAELEVARSGAIEDAHHAIRVLLVGSKAMLRGPLHALLERRDPFAVVGIVSEGDQAQELIRRTHPHVVLLDARGTDALAAVRRIRAAARLTHANIVLLGPLRSEEYVIGALRTGVTGVIERGVDGDRLAGAVRAAATGGLVLVPSPTRRLFAELAASPEHPTPRPAQLRALTRRERQVVALAARGMSDAQIADQLGVSRTTARSHVTRAMRKIGARNRAWLMVLAHETGLVTPPALPRRHGPRSVR